MEIVTMIVSGLIVIGGGFAVGYTLAARELRKREPRFDPRDLDALLNTPPPTVWKVTTHRTQAVQDAYDLEEASGGRPLGSCPMCKGTGKKTT